MRNNDMRVVERLAGPLRVEADMLALASVQQKHN